MASRRTGDANADKRLAKALREIQKGQSIRGAARASGVGRERLSRELTKRGFGSPKPNVPYEPKRSLKQIREHRSQERMNKALRDMSQAGLSARQAAGKRHISRSRLGTRAKELEFVEYERGKQFKITRELQSEMITFTDGGIQTVKLSPEEASRNSYYLNMVHRALNPDQFKITPGEAARDLQAMAGEGVTDIYGDFHPWVTDLEDVEDIAKDADIPDIASKPV